MYYVHLADSSTHVDGSSRNQIELCAAMHVTVYTQYITMEMQLLKFGVGKADTTRCDPLAFFILSVARKLLIL